ncbi:hypothetical protein QBC47DRAFT_395105, partial [Echria macrotheca]
MGITHHNLPPLFLFLIFLLVSSSSQRENPADAKKGILQNAKLDTRQRQRDRERETNTHRERERVILLPTQPATIPPTRHIPIPYLYSKRQTY